VREKKSFFGGKLAPYWDQESYEGSTFPEMDNIIQHVKRGDLKQSGRAMQVDHQGSEFLKKNSPEVGGAMGIESVGLRRPALSKRKKGHEPTDALRHKLTITTGPRDHNRKACTSY